MAWLYWVILQVVITACVFVVPSIHIVSGGKKKLWKRKAMPCCILMERAACYGVQVTLRYITTQTPLGLILFSSGSENAHSTALRFSLLLSIKRFIDWFTKYNLQIFVLTTLSL